MNNIPIRQPGCINSPDVFLRSLFKREIISGTTMIVTPTKIINTTKAVSKKQQEDINLRMQKETEQNLASELIDSYAKDMDVRVKYRLLGLED